MTEGPERRAPGPPRARDSGASADPGVPIEGSRADRADVAGRLHRPPGRAELEYLHESARGDSGLQGRGAGRRESPVARDAASGRPRARVDGAPALVQDRRARPYGVPLYRALQEVT